MPAEEVVKEEMAVPVIRKELPPIPPGLPEDAVTLCLFYQCGAEPPPRHIHCHPSLPTPHKSQRLLTGICAEELS